MRVFSGASKRWEMFQTDNDYVLEHLLLMLMHINNMRPVTIEVMWPFS